MSDLSGVEAKIQRADRQVAELKLSIEEALAPGRQSFEFEIDPKSGQHLYRVLGVPTDFMDWRLLVGEILYNLRSALDHLAWQLVELGGAKPNEQTYFPVRETPFDRKGNLVGAQFRPPIKHTQILDLLEECQPYRGIQGELVPFDRDPLWRLHRLNIIDKHRLLLVMASVFSVNEMWWGWNDDYGPSPTIRYNAAPLKEGSPVAWFDFHGNEPPPGFDPHPAMHISLYEADMPDLVHVPIDTALDTFRWWVEHNILDWRFRPLFT